MSHSIRALDEEHRLKLDLLKEHYKGIFQALQAMRDVGYIPDHGSMDLETAIDKVYSSIEDTK